MSKLISGKEAKKAWGDGGVIQFTYKEHIDESTWINIIGSDSLNTFERDDIVFREIPRTIKIGEFEVPAPFKPKEDCKVYIINDSNSDGYRLFSYELSAHSWCAFIGMWRTEEEIKQVVTALRSVLNGK